MSFVAAAIGAAGAIGGALISSRSARSAANQQSDATEAAIALQREQIGEQKRQYDTTRADFTPWRETGVRALGQLETDINRMPTPAEVMSDPGYQFGMDQGQQALDRKIAAMGGRVSGAALKATSRFNQGYAGNAYGAAYQRRQDRLNRLAALAGIGQTATGASAAAGQASQNAISNLTGSISGLIAGQGDANAAATMYGGNVWGNTANQIGALLSRGANTTQPMPVPQFGPTWQQQGGAMDTNYYGGGL
jgi:hypothetical protein